MPNPNRMYGIPTPDIKVKFPLKSFFILVLGIVFQLVSPGLVHSQAIQLQDGALYLSSPISGQVELEVNGDKTLIIIDQGKGILPVELHQGLHYFRLEEAGYQGLYYLTEGHEGLEKIKRIPMWMAVLPPLLAIAFALIFKEVVISLFAGVWLGAFIAAGLDFKNLISSFFSTIDQYLIPALADPSHMAVIIFSLFIGGIVAIISKNGGMMGVVDKISSRAKSETSAQISTWFMGVIIFFDDYANTLIVGNTMRAITDKYKISREKLAYIVDSTAAPVAAVAFITTWIGAELGYIGDGIGILENFPFSVAPYGIFLDSLKYSFYPVLTLVFILILIKQGRDYGPMLKAEIRSRKTGQVSPAASPDEDEPNMEDLTPVKGAPANWLHAAIPIGVVILLTALGLLVTGFQTTYENQMESGVALTSDSWSAILGSLSDQGFFERLGTIIGNSDSYAALLWASFGGLVVAIGISVGSRVFSLFNSIHYTVVGFKTILPAIVILALAWSLAITTEQLHTTDFLSSLLADNLAPQLLPMLIFIIAAFISFSTGSSWSTMAILYPIAIPTTWLVCTTAGLPSEYSYEILLNVISVVLGASVLGDHCSPISDTTILSSLASDCNHIDHVKTQLPYALTVGGVSLFLCGFSSIFPGNMIIHTIYALAGMVGLWFVVRNFGKKVSELL